LKLYDTQTKQLLPLAVQGDRVSVYACGITPYDTTHLGHAFTYASVDILVRYLELIGKQPRYVQNVTDIDDDILRKAREVGEDWRALGDRWTAHFIVDMQSLNMRPPDVFPRATDVIPQIVGHVERLIHAGVAYEANGSVYFDVDAWPDFGRLAQLSKDELLPIANERGNHPDDPNKRQPLDFVLWQAQQADEPAWESPWGAGRPGWHIECSTLSGEHLGETVDVHAGGADLLFPHHECEIAQVEPITGTAEPFVRNWMHVAMVRHEGEKMSKSLGNLVMVRDLLKEWSPDALRVYLSMHHYRETWSHDETQLARAQGIADLLKSAVQLEGAGGVDLDADSAENAFRAAMGEDLRSPEALQALVALAEAIQGAAQRGEAVADAQSRLRALGGVLGLRLDAPEPEARVIAGWQEHLQRFQP